MARTKEEHIEWLRDKLERGFLLVVHNTRNTTTRRFLNFWLQEPTVLVGTVSNAINVGPQIAAVLEGKHDEDTFTVSLPRGTNDRTDTLLELICVSIGIDSANVRFIVLG